MTAPATTERRPRARRLGLIVGAGVVLLAIVAALVVFLVTRPATGIDAALEDEGFASCLEGGGSAGVSPSVDDAGSWSAEDEVAFWSQPIALDCASRHLSHDRRERALLIAFPSLAGDAAGEIQDQWQPILDYAAWLHEQEEPRDIAMLRVASIVGALWVARSDNEGVADGFVNAAVLQDMQLRDELPGWNAWHAEFVDDDAAVADALFQYRRDVLEKAGDETESAYREYLDRTRAIYDVVR